ncbi:MAG: TonB-dependent receptor plug domain-containing protein [Pseudohongiellaceae bacterium]|nr:TonB-dependent receptor plug domain-containing protein [Pseudohongiellaceae bacterium]
MTSSPSAKSFMKFGITSVRPSILALAIALSSSFQGAAAQEESDSTVVYPASYFDQYTPVSANDMVTRIPGVNVRGNSGGGRGLGSGGDLLIDGKRLAGKDNSATSQLSRIAADQVERIELIRGSSSELDVRGASQVVNVVLKEANRRSSISAEVDLEAHEDGTIDEGGSFSYGGQTGDLNYLFNLEAEPQYNHPARLEYSYAPDLSLNEYYTEEMIRPKTKYSTSMNLGYDMERDRFQFNALMSEEGHPAELNRNFFSPGNPIAYRGEYEDREYDRSNWEIGGNYEHSFDNNSRFQFLFVSNEEIRDSLNERFDISGGVSSQNLYLESNSRTRERIAQTNYNWRLSDTQDMRVGLERAQTILDTELFIGSPSSETGDIVIKATNPGSTVEEMRYEGFAVHNWTLNDRMSLESTLLYEVSTIEQSGTANQSRDFDFIRPKLDYRFDINSSLQLRATIERVVSQLSFSSFTASTNGSDNDKDTEAGNPDLSQELENRYEMTLEYRLPNDGGVLSARAFYRDIDNVIDKINVSDDPLKPESTTGNLGNGRRYGLYLDASTRLGFLGLPDAVLTSSLNVFDSYVYDPILGQDRRFNGRGYATIDFRHDITSMGLSYGFDMRQNFSGGNKSVDVNTLSTDDDGLWMKAFVSKVAFNNTTLRLQVDNVLGVENCRERMRFDGLVALGNINEIEDSCFDGGGRKLKLKLKTTF